MSCIHVQRNFSFAYIKEMIHQNCCWLWRRRKQIFPSVPCALLWFLCSSTWEWVKHISGWFLCCVKDREEFACLVLFVSTVCSGKLQYRFSIQPVGFGCADSPSSLAWTKTISPSPHTLVYLTQTWLLQGLLWPKGFLLESLPSAVKILLKCHHGSSGTFKELILGQIVTQDRERKCQGLLLSRNGV